MKSIHIPTILQEGFGEETTLLELVLILTVSTISTPAVFYVTQAEWSGIPLWKLIILFVLIFDIFAGFISNLTYSTNAYYQVSRKKQLTLIAIHIQPLIFALIFGGFTMICLLAWMYTIFASLVVVQLGNFPAQKAVAGSLVALGLVGLFLGSNGLPLILLVALAFFQLKLIYSFSVDHYMLNRPSKS
jgi:hypothetical protein